MRRSLAARGAAALLLVGCTAPARPAPVAAAAPAVPAAPPPASQNPSPMVERARRHERLPKRELPGLAFTIDSVLARPVEVFVPARAEDSAAAGDRTLLVHLFGASYVPMAAAAAARGRYVLAVVNLGGGSAAYERPFADSTLWPRLRARIDDELRRRAGVRATRTYVSAFSAGYGGVRALLRDERSAAAIDGVLLLDGLHVSYIPERRVLADSGVLDSARLEPFLRYARRAAAGERRMVITHSEIFPGTFASTTETTDWLLGALGLARTPVLAWGPVGMQQLSEARAGRLSVLGFAGNTGPDHIDHLHGMTAFLDLLDRD